MCQLRPCRRTRPGQLCADIVAKVFCRSERVTTLILPFRRSDSCAFEGSRQWSLPEAAEGTAADYTTTVRLSRKRKT